MNTTLAIVWPGRSGSSGAGVLASDNRNFLPLRGAAKACDATASDAAHAVSLREDTAQRRYRPETEGSPHNRSSVSRRSPRTRPGKGG